MTGDKRRELERAMTFVAKGRQIVEDQRARIARIKNAGHDISAAVKSLSLFEITLKELEHYEALIRSEISTRDPAEQISPRARTHGR